MTKIFVLLQHHNQKSLKDFTKLRLVCSRWRDVFDENITFSSTLNNRTLHGPTMSHVRVDTCTVNDLYERTPPSNQRLFRDPTLIKQLYLNGRVSRGNFFWLINQLGNLDHLSISLYFLKTNEHLFQNNNSVEKTALQRFWANINAIDFFAIDVYIFKLQFNIPKSMASILSFDMPNLKSVKILIHWSLEFYNSLLSFLLRNPSVNKIHIMLDDREKPESHNTSQPEVLDWGKIQLKRIEFTTHCTDVESQEKMSDLIKSQRSLEELYFSKFNN